MTVPTQQEQFKLDIVSRYLAGKIPRKVALKALRVSEDTFRRYCRAYEKKGVLFLKHGNSGKRPHNKISDFVRSKIQALLVMKYYDFNVQHLKRKLRDVEGIPIGRETLRKIVCEMKMIKEPKRRRVVRQRRDRMSQAGMMIQMDGSPHAWFGTKKSVLIAGIDDASSDVWGKLFWTEDTIGYMEVLHDIARQNGLPEILYTDKAGLWGERGKRADFTQMKRACAELGISWIPAHSPEAKGRIERLFKTFQDRLVPEMRLRGITTMAEANRYLKHEFLPDHLLHFGVEPENPQSAFRYIAPTVDLNQIFCLKYPRKIMKNHTISWNDKIYDVIPPDGICIAGHSLEIRIYHSGTMAAFYRNQRVELKEVNAPLKICKG